MGLKENLQNAYSIIADRVKRNEYFYNIKILSFIS